MISFMWNNFFKKGEDKTLECIKNCFIFEELTASELNNLSRFVHIRNYRPGESIFSKGEIGVGMYIVLNGKVDIFVNAQEENPRPVTTLMANDFMGEISLVENKSRRTATAMAREEVSLIGFFKPDLDSIIERNPSMGAKILNQLARVLGRRLRETARKVTELRSEMK